MNIPTEFADYLTTPEYLTPREQEERFTAMREDEIHYRTKLLHSLGFDKETVKRRLRGNMEWAYEMLDGPPSVYGSIDRIVDETYAKLAGKDTHRT